MNHNKQEFLLQNINRISEGTEIIGSITTPGDIRIDGSFEGSITSKGKVVIGEKGKIKGDINCYDADIWGIFEGALHASEIITLKEVATVIGDIKTQKLVLEAGAVFNGSCAMFERQQPEK
ncbi:MAG: polymer-forming cytoskeletal protein [Prevotellaceae bacterium]|nr:polymer-forming cytoskeletal protein [Prevotellaceae bacterium]